MPPDDFQNEIESPENEQIIKEIEADNEKDYLTELKKKNKEFLVGNLSDLEKQRIADFICDRIDESRDTHKDLSDKIDDWNDVYLMKRKEVVGSSGDMPNYRSGTSTVALETVHANEMNVFFTPKDPVRVLPTEENDVPKIKKLSTFANWSFKNELNLFENLDRIFHNSKKTGEAPFIIHWVKVYGIEIEREIVRNPANPSEPLIDPDTKQPLFQEREKPKLLYNGPKLEPFSRKDYIQPKNAIMDKTPDWEARIMRITYDEYLRDELQGKMYAGTSKSITGWGSTDSDSNKLDTENETIPLGQYEKEFHQWYGRMRINIIKENKEDKTVEMRELEDEFIALVHKPSRTLCQLRKNRFPLKLRPIVVHYFIPDDDGRRKGIGMIEFLDGIQKAYDVLYNQYLGGVTKSNQPVVFMTPFGNLKREKYALDFGTVYHTADPKSVVIWRLPPPDSQINIALELITQWAQLMFGISDYSAGVESKIDPTAPAKKAEIVVAQGNVRMNMIIKRENRTIQEIGKRWYLLYKENMPENKFVRIAGYSEQKPFEFQSVSLEDFALNAIPDFEFTGNILNSNKTLEAQRALAIYQVFIQNALFAPQTTKGLQAYHQLTKWLADKLDDTGLSRFVPEVPGDVVHTPEEENARFLQGDTAEPLPNEDHVDHIRKHTEFITDPSVPEIVRKNVLEHNNKHIALLKQLITQQMVFQQAGINPQQFTGNNPEQIQQPTTGGGNGQAVFQNAGQGTNTPAPGVFQRQPAGVG